MSSDELYKEVILDHYQDPRNRGQMPDATIANRGHNPLCGDDLMLYLKLDGDTVEAASFEGRGCSISQASASMLTESVEGLSLAEAEHLAEQVRGLMKGQEPDEDLGDIEALSGVRHYPVRVKCATLAWNTLQESLKLYRQRTVRDGALAENGR